MARRVTIDPLRLSPRTGITTFAVAIALLLAIGPAAAGVIKPDGGTSIAPIASCAGPPAYPAGVGPFTNCNSTAFFSGDDATIDSTFIRPGDFSGTKPTTETFKDSFDNWNHAHGDLWTLMNGGTLDITFNVNPFTAGASKNTGGIENITITLSDYKPAVGGPTLDQLVWTQALYVNDSPTTPFGQHVVPPAVTLDNYSFNKGGSGSGGVFKKDCSPLPGQTPGPNNTTPANIGATPADTAYCDPIYPFQFDDKSFFDAPKFGWPDGSFRAIALLSTVTFKTDNTGKITERDLTVFDGVGYGFDLKAPEPSSIALLATALPLILYRRRKRFS